MFKFHNLQVQCQKFNTMNTCTSQKKEMFRLVVLPCFDLGITVPMYLTDEKSRKENVYFYGIRSCLVQASTSFMFIV